MGNLVPQLELYAQLHFLSDVWAGCSASAFSGLGLLWHSVGDSLRNFESALTLALSCRRRNSLA